MRGRRYPSSFYLPEDWAVGHVAVDGRGRAILPGYAPALSVLLTEDGDRLVLETGAPVIRDETIPAVTPTDDPDPAAWLVLVQDGVTVKATVAQTRTYING